MENRWYRQVLPAAGKQPTCLRWSSWTTVARKGGKNHHHHRHRKWLMRKLYAKRKTEYGNDFLHSSQRKRRGASWCSGRKKTRRRGALSQGMVSVIFSSKAATQVRRYCSTGVITPHCSDDDRPVDEDRSRQVQVFCSVMKRAFFCSFTGFSFTWTEEGEAVVTGRHCWNATREQSGLREMMGAGRFPGRLLNWKRRENRPLRRRFVASFNIVLI